MPPVELWARAFGWTVLFEAPIVVAGTSRQLGWRGALALGVGLQALTHPALWYLAPRFGPYALWVLVWEAVVIAVEAAVLGAALRARGLPASAAFGRGLGVAVAANVGSVLGGLLVSAGS